MADMATFSKKFRIRGLMAAFLKFKAMKSDNKAAMRPYGRFSKEIDYTWHFGRWGHKTAMAAMAALSKKCIISGLMAAF